jgi:hypothetical protein
MPSHLGADDSIPGQRPHRHGRLSVRLPELVQPRVAVKQLLQLYPALQCCRSPDLVRQALPRQHLFQCSAAQCHHAQRILRKRPVHYAPP